jgi:hypothetical protein
MKTESIELSGVVYRDGDMWVVQCIQHDIAAFTETVDQLAMAFERALAANLCANEALGRHGLDGIPPAPDRFREAFEASTVNVQSRDAGVHLGELRLAEAA